MSVLQRNNVKVFGSGTVPMVFAHGYGCDQNMWRFITPAFEKTHKIVLLDHVGFGNSDLSAFSPEKYDSLQSFARDLLEICDELGLKDVVLVGHSVSSMIGMLAGIERPDLFSRMVFIGPSPCYINDGEYVGGFSKEDVTGLLAVLDSNYLGWSQTMAPVIMGNPERPELAGELSSSFCRTDPRIAKNFAALTFLSDNRADLIKLETPTVVLQCSEDSIAPLSVGEYVHQHLPVSVFHLLKATGHCPHLSSPEETISAMREGLAQLSEK
jgi:sigma-B regulation protein RsbQ